ncbi:MAG: hypothetical protein A2Z37_07750 [Chloroflexi bacterium RBG_19FT_COMBO_62_14]|nr:MAG: hypothetical protein A2Z37_07750 [Chloroflexi bacterium RBG_19FT_COMBO_62_14]
MLISTERLTGTSLMGQIAHVAGTGRGFGFEACRSLIWLGAQVVLAEIDRETGGEGTTGRLELRTASRLCGSSVIMILSWTLRVATRRTLSGFPRRSVSFKAGGMKRRG